MWTDIEAEKISETEKAIELDFGNGKRQWFPKSCYREINRGAFHGIQQVKIWFVTQNRLWNLVNLKCSPI